MLKIKNYHLGIHRQDRARAVEILVKDLKVFSSFNEELFKEITQLLTLDNFRYVLLFIFWRFWLFEWERSLEIMHRLSEVLYSWSELDWVQLE